VCLSAEAVEILYRIGAGDRVVGITAFALEPPAARRKPRVSGFSSINYQRIEALRPDLIITFSDVQAEAARELIRRGYCVLSTNQRSLAEIVETVLLLGRVVGCSQQAFRLAANLRMKLVPSAPSLRRAAARPSVYFEEWNDPLISGVRWVSELIDLAGGRDLFPELRQYSRAPDRVVSKSEVLRRQPEIIVASWCGKKVDLGSFRKRPGWSGIPAVRNGRIYEIESCHILQPGPSLLKGLSQLRAIIRCSASG
jgi:iron complex transport system substrate-binding protein